MVGKLTRRALLVQLAGLATCLGRPRAAFAGEAAVSPLVRVPEPIEAPEIGLADLDGVIHSMAEFRGRVVVVSFWAAWCAPCRREMPSLARLVRALPADRFAVLAINLGDKPERMSDFLSRIDHEGLVVISDAKSALARSWNIYGLPVSYVVDPTGRISLAALGAIEWDAAEVREHIVALAG